MGSPWSSQYGAYQYQTPEVRALAAITPESYDYQDESKLLSKLVGDTSYMAAYMKKMQTGIDQANENFIQQLQDLINEMLVLFGGHGDTGFDWGDLKYIFQGIGALFGWDVSGGLVLPLNLHDAAMNFMNQYVIGSEDWQELMDENFDSSIATMLDVFGEVPILGQAAEQLATILSQMHDTNRAVSSLFNQFFAAFNISPTNPLPTIGDWFTNINKLYTGLDQLFGGDTPYGDASSVYSQISRWDQQVIDAIAKLGQGDLSGFAIQLSQITQAAPDKQIESSFSSVDAIAANPDGWTRDATVGRTNLGSARVPANGFMKAMAGTEFGVYGGQKVTPSVWVQWSGLVAIGDAIILQLRCNDQDIEVAKITNPATSSGWVQLTNSITIPSTTYKVKPRIVVTGNCTAGTIWFDDAPVKYDQTLLLQDWIQDLPTQWDHLTSLWGKNTSDLIGADATEWWENAFAEIFPPIPQSNIDQLNAFWDGIKSWLGLDHITDIPSIDANWWNNIISGNLFPGGVASTTTTNNLNSMLNQIGDIFDDLVVTPINTAMTNLYNWWNGLLGPHTQATNHQTLMDAVNVGITGTSVPNAQPADVQVAISSVVDNVSTLQGAVQDIQTAIDTSTPAGNRFVDEGQRVSAHDWGSGWTVTGTGDVGNNNDFHFNLSGATARKKIGIFNSPTLTDYQVVTAVMSVMMDTNFGVANTGIQLITHADSPINPQNYVYAFFKPTVVELGCYKAGVKQTPFATWSISPSSGAKLRIISGTSSGTRTHIVLLNGYNVGSISETVSNVGAGYRYGGLGMVTDVAYSRELSPGKVSYWALQDNAPTGLIGSFFQAGGSSYTNPGTGVQTPTGGWLTLIQETPDISMDSNSIITVTKAGTYIAWQKLVFQTALGYTNSAQLGLTQNGVVKASGEVRQGGYPTSYITQISENFFLPVNAGDTLQYVTNLQIGVNCVAAISLARL